MRQNKVSRRGFVSGAAGVAFGAMVVPRHVLGGQATCHRARPSTSLSSAAAARGAADAGEIVAGGQNLVALVDVDFGFVDSAMAGRARGRDGQPNPSAVKLQEAYGKAKRYADYRKMLDERKDIDGVVVATPDHTHAVIAKAAMELGKHVYVEKPLTWSVHEARVLQETARRTKVVTQMGNQGHSSEGAALINEWVRAGVIGPVREVHVWTNRPIWPQGIPRPGKPAAVPAGARGGRGRGGGNGNRWNSRRLNETIALAIDGGETPPPGLEWDLFLGPAPEVAFHPIYHPFNWRGWLDWGTGALGDMDAPDRPSLFGTWPQVPDQHRGDLDALGDRQQESTSELPARDAGRVPLPGARLEPPVKMTWCDGGLMPGRPEVLPHSVTLDRGGGVILIGEKGILLHGTYGDKPKLYPELLMEEARCVPKSHPPIQTADGPKRSAPHRMNWIDAIRERSKTTCPFEYAGPLTETMLLGVAALRTGQRCADRV